MAKRFMLACIPMLLFCIHTNAQYQINGNATELSCNCYQLTPNLGNQAGSVWNVNLIDLNNPFDFTFQVFLGNNDSGADGIAFGLQPLGTSIGTDGGGMGFAGVAPSVGVFIDTYRNSNPDLDPIQDHISIDANGNTVHDGGLNSLTPAFEVGDIEDGEFHDLNVIWTGPGQTLTVFFDDVQVAEYTGDIINTIFSGNPEVFWGFTGATGSLSNIQQVCTSANIEFDVSLTSVCPGVPVTFSDSSEVFGNIVDWDWDFGDASTGSGAVVEHTFEEFGEFMVTLTVTDEAGCSHEESIPVVVDFPELILSAQPESVCAGNPVTIVAEYEDIAGPACSYLIELFDSFGDGWSGNVIDVIVDGQVIESFTLNAGSEGIGEFDLPHNTEFSLVFTSATWTTEVSFNLIDAFGNTLQEFSNLAEGMTTVYTGVMDCGFTGNEYSIVWDDASLNVSSDGFSAMTTPSNSGAYTATLSDPNGCSIDANVEITVSNMIHTDSVLIASCEENDGAITITSIGGIGDYFYLIADSGFASNTGLFSNLYPGTYEIQIQDELACTDFLTVELEEVPCSLTVFIPNVFSPNDDDMNPNFSIELQGGSEPVLQVFNRWGKLVYETVHVETGWNGDINGSPASEGTYYYVLNTKEDMTGEFKSFAGSLELLR